MGALFAKLHETFPALLSSGLLAYAVLVGADHGKRMMVLYRLIRRYWLRNSYAKIAPCIPLMLALGLSALYPMGEFLHELFPDIC